LVYEPGYYDRTYEHITAAYVPMHYESAIREVTIRYCQSTVDNIARNFSFTYEVFGKHLFEEFGDISHVQSGPEK